jgi:FtsP/CotA-like multicopper oxidase with cupredoxin domain
VRVISLAALTALLVTPTVRRTIADHAPPARSSAQPATATCAASPRGAAGDADLYCIELLPGPGIDGAAGTARLTPPQTPFGIAVTAAGEQLHDLSFSLAGLPEPKSLGAYSAYVAWATTPQMTPEIRLGEVRNGEARLGPVPFDRFLILITAEASAAAKSRSGRIVLRGTSASVRMQPHDLAFLLAGLLDKPGAAAADAHAGHAMPAAPGEWTPPPMYPGVAMPPAMMTLRPDVSPYAPAADDAPMARPRELLRLADGASIRLTAAPVRRIIAGRTVTMLGFNGQYPGPLIEVTERSTITATFVNHTDFPTAVHWHGLRLDNRFDGAPHVTQDPVPPGGTFEYRVTFPDAGLYWYHPHHREDVLQDLGLYGNMMVRSREPDFFAPAHREEVLMLDDLLTTGGGLVGHGRESPTHALMGRFGNLLLVNGEPRWEARARRGEVVRFFFTNVSSTRVFNLSFEGAGKAGGGVRMKVVASDLGRYEREAWVDHITIAPAERYIVDARFEAAGEVSLVNRVRAIDHIQARFFEERQVMGAVRVSADAAGPDYSASFARLRHNAAVSSDIDRFRQQFARALDRELLVTLQPGDLPFPLRPMLTFESVYRNPVEWTGTMPEMDWVVSGRQAQWLLRDAATGRQNMDIDWRFKVGDVVKLRVVNDRNALHAMHHPIHIHGQRFLVLSTNGVANQHLVWKDTMLLPTGFSSELLLELTNPGKWMLHCHVAEHIESGMRMVFEVAP